MKLALRLTAALMAAILLAGCTKSGSIADAPEESKLEEASSNHSLHMLEKGSAEGRYTILYPETDGTASQLLNYLDYSTLKAVPLCAQPNCTHSGPACSAFVEGSLNDIYVLDDDSIVFLVRTSENCAAQIYTAGSDGSNRQMLFEAPSGLDISALFGADEDYLYMLVSKVQANGTSCENFARLSLSGGKLETLMEFGQGSFFSPIGTWGQQIVVFEDGSSAIENLYQEAGASSNDASLSMDEMDKLRAQNCGQYRWYLYDPYSGKTSDLDSWEAPFDQNWGRTFLWSKDRIYWMDSSKAGPLHWVTPDGQTGALELHWPDEIQNAPDCSIHLETVVQGQVLAAVSGPWDNVEKRFALDLQSDTPTEIPFHILSNGREIPIPIYGQSSDSLLVELELRMEDSLFVHDDGTVDQTGSCFSRYGLISFEDFLAGRNNYREFSIPGQIALY